MTAGKRGAEMMGERLPDVGKLTLDLLRVEVSLRRKERSTVEADGGARNMSLCGSTKRMSWRRTKS